MTIQDSARKLVREQLSNLQLATVTDARQQKIKEFTEYRKEQIEKQLQKRNYFMGTPKRKCPICGFKIRGSNHDESPQHKAAMSR